MWKNLEFPITQNYNEELNDSIIVEEWNEEECLNQCFFKGKIFGRRTNHALLRLICHENGVEEN